MSLGNNVGDVSIGEKEMEEEYEKRLEKWRKIELNYVKWEEELKVKNRSLEKWERDLNVWAKKLKEWEKEMDMELEKGKGKQAMELEVIKVYNIWLIC